MNENTLVLARLSLNEAISHRERGVMLDEALFELQVAQTRAMIAIAERLDGIATKMNDTNSHLDDLQHFAGSALKRMVKE